MHVNPPKGYYSKTVFLSKEQVKSLEEWWAKQNVNSVNKKYLPGYNKESTSGYTYAKMWKSANYGFSKLTSGPNDWFIGSPSQNVKIFTTELKCE